jgi:hypothetical protein
MSRGKKERRIIIIIINNNNKKRSKNNKSRLGDLITGNRSIRRKPDSPLDMDTFDRK